LSHYDFWNIDIKKWDSISLVYNKQIKNKWKLYNDVISVYSGNHKIWNIPDPKTDFWKKFISLTTKKTIISKCTENINNKITWKIVLCKNTWKSKNLKIII
jgi:hypothetical protein